MTKEQVQNTLDDFILRNDAQLQVVKNQNAQLHSAIMDAFAYLYKRFGTLEEQIKEEKIQEAISAPEPEPVIEASPEIVQSEVIEEIKQEVEEQLSLEDLKEAIKTLRPLAEFDDDIKAELKRLQTQLMKLKFKKS